MLFWMNSRLNRRFIAATAAGLLVSTLIFILLFIGMYRSEIGHAQKEAASQVNQLLRTSLENAMLKRDLEGLRSIVSGLGNQPNIVDIMITNPAGEIRFSSSNNLLGKHLFHDASEREATTGFVINHQGSEVLRSINPVQNKPPCIECHGPIEKSPVNGILYVDYDAASLRSNAKETTLVLMGTGSLIVIINIAGGWWFIRRYILKPVATLSEASEALSVGKLETRVRLSGHDELATLGNTFNRMAENLQEKISELAEKEAFLQSLVDAIPDGVRIIDSEYKVILANKTYRDQLGLSDNETLGYCYETTHGRSEPCPPTLTSCPIHEITITQQPIKVLHQHVRTDGSKMGVEVYAAPLRSRIHGIEQQLIVESIRDLEETVKYSHEQKLSELGRLATGVAHEIYNPLASVRFALHDSQQALEAMDTPTDEISNYLNVLEKEVDKCVTVTERLLKLSAPPGSPTQLINISTLLNDTISLIKWEAESNKINIIQNYEEDIRLLAIDGDMRMVTLNLVQNAFHAMPEGGTLEISCSRGEKGVVIRFADSGKGIKAHDLKYVFDPFFSRRADGSHGTGLGLSIVKAIIENHDGTISVSSKPEQGSVFEINLTDPDRSQGSEP
ncbi:MAG: ATP-binding protein [Candidatus Sedimenticola sp. PURPLELP]